MSFTTLFFLAALIATVGMAGAYGGRDERLAGFALVVAALATPVVVSRSYSSPEFGVIAVDMGLFMALATIALRSKSFWPIWASGFQLGLLAVHLAASRMSHMLPAAYAESLAIWSYLVMAAVVCGVWLEARPHYGRS